MVVVSTDSADFKTTLFRREYREAAIRTLESVTPFSLMSMLPPISSGAKVASQSIRIFLTISAISFVYLLDLPPAPAGATLRA